MRKAKSPASKRSTKTARRPAPRELSERDLKQVSGGARRRYGDASFKVTDAYAKVKATDIAYDPILAKER